MDRETLCNHLKYSLRKMSLEDFARLFVNEIVAVEEFFKLCKNVNAGKTISLLFNPHRLNIITEASVVKISNPMSIYQSIFDEGSDDYTEKIDGLARLYLYNLEHGVSNPFYATVQRGYNGVAYVNEFPPYVARQIYTRYKNGKQSLKVLDPCCGWGGRMIGCASIPNTTYIGCEPCTQTYEGLLKLGEWLKTLQPSFSYVIYKVQFEEFISEGGFDIALTSPPYYNTEHYSEEETNSMNRYKTYDMWVDGFYKPLISKTVDLLTDEGVFVLNIGDRKYPLSDDMIRICKDLGINVNRINDYLSSNNEAGEKFYSLSRSKKYNQLFTRSLF